MSYEKLQIRVKPVKACGNNGVNWRLSLTEEWFATDCCGVRGFSKDGVEFGFYEFCHLQVKSDYDCHGVRGFF